MATGRFLNLPEEKRARILTAGFQEFSKYSFQEASINRIIKNADISRGSFYTYFEDKMACLCFILAELVEKFNDEVFRFLGRSRGDPFVCAEQIYELCRDSLKSSEAMGFVKNLFSDQAILRELLAPDGFRARVPSEGCQGIGLREFAETEPENAKERVRVILSQATLRMAAGIDRETYDLDEERVAFLYPLLLMLTIRCAASAAEHPEREEMLRRGLQVELGLLKYGAARRQNAVGTA